MTPVLATITRARDTDEEALIGRALQAASDGGFPLIVCDGGSRAEFVERLRAIPRTIVVRPPANDLVVQIRHAIAAALSTGAERVLYSEPDKAAFLAHHVRLFVDACSTSPEAVGVAARTPDAFRTFPAVQQFTESTINELTSDAVSVRGDYSYGPLLLPRASAELALRAPERLGWGWRHFVVVLAHRAGTPILLHPGDFACPQTQRLNADAERIHRLTQLAQNVDGLVAGLTFGL